MIFFIVLCIISFILALLGDKYALYGTFNFPLTKAFYKIFFLSLIILILSTLISNLNLTSFSQYAYLNNLPYTETIVLSVSLYIIISSFFYYYKIKEQTKIRAIPEKHVYPKDYLQLLLTSYVHFKETLELKLNLLKAFSPIPIILLLLPNIQQVISSVFSIPDKLPALDTNFVSFIFICWYFYSLLMTYYSWRKNMRFILVIQETISLCDNPNLFQKKS
ncbi:hypothetical protein [Listeria fleischmannii]|uniref:Uncharacterized protein n=1 Tax=Listeria fleischmannii TaxID=1069827 RepID=A0A841YI13_9LIST|nr:hypothetical protein [Listeria fleischmannii]MBC1399916.1 hypothetical protein [Listeria fleischmannii]